MIFCEFCKFFKNTFFRRAPWWLPLASLIQGMYTQLEITRCKWYTFYLMNNMWFNVLLNNWALNYYSVSSSNLENKGSVWKEHKRAHFRDKWFLLHLKKGSVRRTSTRFLDYCLFFKSDQPNEESSKQPTGRCSKNCVLWLKLY